MRKIIDNYSDLKVGPYFEILSINSDEMTDALHKQVKTLEILSGMSEKEILHLPIVEYHEMAVASHFLTKELREDELHYNNVPKVIEVGDFQLVPLTDYDSMTIGQATDFAKFLRMGGFKYIIEAVACLFVPKGMKYQRGYSFDEVVSAIKENLSVVDFFSLGGFYFGKFFRDIDESVSLSKKEIEGLPDPEKKKSFLRQIKEVDEMLDQVKSMVSK